MKIVVMLFALVIPTAAQASTISYDQGFEADVSGWFGTGGTVTRVASGGGMLGIASSGGSFHAEVELGSSPGSGGFTQFGGYTYSWPGYIEQSLDIYIDPNAGVIGDGWFLDNAVNDDTNDNNGVSSGSDWREAGGVGALKATDGFWWITADADGGAYPGPAAGGTGLRIEAANWYTIVSEWNANVDGLTVDRDTHIYDSSGALLYSNLNPQQVPLSGAFPLGGTRYGWLAQAVSGGNAFTLAIDNSSLAVPEPSSWLLAAMGLMGLVACKRQLFSNCS